MTLHKNSIKINDFNINSKIGTIFKIFLLTQGENCPEIEYTSAYFSIDTYPSYLGAVSNKTICTTITAKTIVYPFYIILKINVVLNKV